MRLCKRCELEKPLEEFYKGSCWKDGYCQYCKKCSKEMRRASWNHSATPRNSRQNTTVSNSRSRNNFRILGDTVWCPKCKNYKNEDNFYKRAGGKYSSWCKSCEKECQAKRRSSVEYKLLRAKLDHERRSKVNLTRNILTKDNILFLYKFQEGTCARCNRKFSNELKYEIDHILPVSKGGDLILSNVQLLCKSCNCSKKDKTIQYRMDISHV